MTVQTRHYGMMGFIGSIVAPLLSTACGTTIPPEAVNTSMALSLIITALDWSAARAKEFIQLKMTIPK